MAAVALIFPLSKSRGEESSSTPPKFLMASLGDSMTAASLADTSLAAVDPSLRVQDLGTRALIENKKTFSWASGEKIMSHYVRLKEYMTLNHVPGTLDMFNAAVPGNKAANLPEQAKSIVDEFKRGQYTSVKYITLLMGNNDACSDVSPIGTPEAAFSEDFMKGLSKLSEIQQSERIPVLVAGLPRIADLGFPAIQNTQVLHGLTCEVVRNRLLKFCNPLTLWKTPAEYQSRNAVVVQKNQLIQRIVEEARVRFPNLDLHFTSAMFGVDLQPSILAVDCFHPSAAGQAMLSSTLWNEQRWFK